MPTKWTRLTLCFMRAARFARSCDARVGDALGGVALADARARAIGHRQQRRARRVLASTPASGARGVSSRLRQHDRARRRRRRKRALARLVVGDRAGQRHEDRADADGGELGDGQRAAAADDEVGLSVARAPCRR